MPPESKTEKAEIYELSIIFFEGATPADWGQRLLRSEESCREQERQAHEIAKANGITVVTACRKITRPAPNFKRERDS
jgi:hypothetical protein